MNRIVGILGATLLALTLLVPVAAAADPSRQDNHVVVNTSGDLTLPAGQHVDLLVVVDGTATIQGDVTGVIVVDGAVNFIGGRASDVFAVRSHVSLDGDSIVSGDIRTVDSEVQQPAGATVQGSIIEGVDVAGAAVLVGSAVFLAYLGFAIAAIVAALVLAGLAARQVRAAGRLISREPGMSVAAGLLGLVGILIAGVLAVLTIVGIPVGLSILLGVLPVLLITGYLVAGIWIGDQIVGRMSPGVTRERPYLAATIGVIALDLLSIVPLVGGVIAFVGFGAVVLLMWRIFLGHDGVAATVDPGVAPAAG